MVMDGGIEMEESLSIEENGRYGETKGRSTKTVATNDDQKHA